MTYTYFPSIPQPGDIPSQSQDQLLNNFQYLNTFCARDHERTVDDSTQQCGTHKQVTFNALGGTPGFAGATSVMYAKVANGSDQVFFNNSLIDAQLTAFKAGVPNSATSGVTSLPGGMLLQWDTVSASNNADITFPITFSGNAYVVIPTILGAGSAFHVQPNSLLPDKWKVNTWTATGAATGGALNVSYIAIGPA